ncbi:MAG: 5-methyltetrahydrofolate--homocysteine methyltransferase, partial [Flavobacteriales bacterium]|nr:5-methyltetrahydrofolate--homocysteine methyltransferase [Flavobacteriales bacterium]
KALIDGGVDILMVETVFDTLNAKAALFGIQTVFDELQKSVPIMVSGTITDASGRTLSGQTPRAFLISIAHADLFSIGFNCALGADQLMPHIDVLSMHANTLVSAHPNAGLPNAMGGYDQSPEEFADLLKPYFERNLVDIIGGCCGTTPEHIRELSNLASQYSPRQSRQQLA